MAKRGESVPGPIAGHTVRLNDKSATQFSAKGGAPSDGQQSRAMRNLHNRSQQPPLDRMIERHSPVLHMQFDETASNALNNTFRNDFKFQGQIQRRNPLKYMHNPNHVQGIVAGTKQYTYQ